MNQSKEHTRKFFYRTVLFYIGINQVLEGKEYRYSKDSLNELVDWIEENRYWIQDLFKTFPSEANLRENSVRYVSSWLKESQLFKSWIWVNVDKSNESLHL